MPLRHDRRAFDGFDHNDPAAPPVWRCWSCDGFLPSNVAFCASCDDESTGYLDYGPDAFPPMPVLHPVINRARQLDPAVWVGGL